jgi:cell wall-associated NlpC family hydrolase
MPRRNFKSSDYTLLGFMLTILAGCASTDGRIDTVAEQRPIDRAPVAARGAGPAPSEAISPGLAIAERARAMLGVPYRYGGADPSSGFDCSGLVYYTYATVGFAAPRTSQAQFRASQKISVQDAEAGDLIFFQDQEKLSHVGIYLGDELFIHAPSSGKTVSVASLNAPYYRRQLVAVGRLLAQ